MAAKFDYAGIAADADELIQYFGMPAVLRREGLADRPCVVALIEFTPRERAADLANPTDRRVVMSALTPAVRATPPDNELDTLVTYVDPLATPLVENEPMPMTCKPKPTAPAGITVLWEFTVRR